MTLEGREEEEEGEDDEGETEQQDSGFESWDHLPSCHFLMLCSSNCNGIVNNLLTHHDQIDPTSSLKILL